MVGRWSTPRSWQGNVFLRMASRENLIHADRNLFIALWWGSLILSKCPTPSQYSSVFRYRISILLWGHSIKTVYTVWRRGLNVWVNLISKELVHEPSLGIAKQIQCKLFVSWCDDSIMYRLTKQECEARSPALSILNRSMWLEVNPMYLSCYLGK